MGTIIVVAIIVLMIFFACRSIYRDKRAGRVCSFCSSGGVCNGHCGHESACKNCKTSGKKK